MTTRLRLAELEASNRRRIEVEAREIADLFPDAERDSPERWYVRRIVEVYRCSWDAAMRVHGMVWEKGTMND